MSDEGRNGAGGHELTSRDLLAAVTKVRSSTLDANRPEALAKRRISGRLTVRQRIDHLLDDASFQEMGQLVEPLRSGRWNADIVAPADGVICGNGEIAGRRVVVYGSDFTAQGGSTGRNGMLKHARAVDRALQHGMPMIYLLEGGGHRIQDGLDARLFAAGSSVFLNLARLSGWAPVVTAVMGAGFAGPTNYAGLSDFVVMIRGMSTMGIAGPALVEASTGHSFTMDEIGGAEMQADQNGLADLAVDTEEECLQAIERFLSYFPSNAEMPAPVHECTDPRHRRDEALLDIVSANTRRAYDVRRVVNLVADTGSTMELKPTYARNIVTTLGRLEGRPVGFIANQPLHRAGMLDAPACEKAAHFIALCDAFGLPIVTFIDVPGFAVGLEAERSGVGRKSARLFYEFGQATVPRASVTLRKGYGAAYYAMGGGRSFEADGAFVWPTAELGALSVEGAVDVAYRRDYQNAADPDGRRRELIAEFKAQLGAVPAASAFGIDDVIDPRDTRRRLIETFEYCAPRRRITNSPPKHRSISPI